MAADIPNSQITRKRAIFTITRNFLPFYLQPHLGEGAVLADDTALFKAHFADGVDQNATTTVQVGKYPLHST